MEMDINQFCESRGISKSELAEKLGYKNRQSLTYIDKARSATFMLKMLRVFPEVFISYESDLGRHELKESELAEMWKEYIRSLLDM
jgi:hypothetical protein